jgi:hypothetical protein
MGNLPKMHDFSGSLSDPPQTQPLKWTRGRWDWALPCTDRMVPDESGKAFDSGVATRQRASAPTCRPPRHLLEPSRAAIGSLPAHRVRICYSPQFGRVKALYTVRPINRRLQHRRCLPPSSFIVFGSFRSRAEIKRCGFHTLRKSVGRIW